MLRVLILLIFLSGSALADTTGIASWYGPGFYGHMTSNGEIYTGKELTAASNSLPMDSSVLVTDIMTHKSVVVRINDRGDFVRYNRVIDLSVAAAQKLDMLNKGITTVQIKLLKRPINNKLTKKHR